MRRALLLAAFAAALPGALAAQGGLSIQGFGYPTGQISSASLALGGASAEVDPASPLNPATIGLSSRYSVYMQFEPEFRTTTIGGQGDKSTTIRFPNFLITGGYRRLTGAISATTFLDRTWSNVYADSQPIGGTTFPSTLNASSTGAITDTRAAVAYWINQKVQVGLGLHALLGENRISFGRIFPDSTGIGGVTQVSTINYSGRAVSAGVVFYPATGFVLGASVRKGGHLEARQDNLALSKADTPDRYGLSVAYTGIPNTTLAARFDRTAWTGMRSLGTAQLNVFDTDDLGLGVEVVGPTMGGAASLARLGFRSRTLPFAAGSEQVQENAFSGGIALPFARGRAQMDLSLQRSTRSAGSAEEKAWFVSLGLGIRP